MESWEGTKKKVFVVATMPLHFFNIDKRGLQCTQSVALFKHFTHYGSQSDFSYHNLTTLSIYSLYNCTPQFLYPEKTTDLPQVTNKLKGNATDLIVITHTLLYPKVLCPQRYRKVLMNGAWRVVFKFKVKKNYVPLIVICPSRTHLFNVKENNYLFSMHNLLFFTYLGVYYCGHSFFLPGWSSPCLLLHRESLRQKKIDFMFVCFIFYLFFLFLF